MKNPIQAMFEAGVVERTDFPPESRYHGVPTSVIVGADGVATTYLQRRFAPQPESFHTLRLRRVLQGERLDQITAAEVGNPEAFWMLCDANGSLWAEELEEEGADVRITLPQGVPGPEEG
ncbi:hypothetical protein [Pelagibius sp. Alg239-R121]|uniref:hypothetical protein n=1 Tax=Pelagibius sp. Alg239-R121 TaxID=2993448 RepID=UPI0024A756D5|nr:hypothetical protein [Pelagibius sp. Alg239-R121]